VVGSCSSQRKMRNVYKFWSENLKGRSHSEDIVIDGSISEWIVDKHVE
jgi:hypothetical protein